MLHERMKKWFESTANNNGIKLFIQVLPDEQNKK